MIKLFEENALDFTTLGVGVLSDVLTAKVTDENNGNYEFEFTYPVMGNLYNEIQLKRIVTAKANVYGNEQPFRIYAISVPIDGKVTINARHISYDLSNYIVEPFEAHNPAEVFAGIQNGMQYLNTQCPFTFVSNYVAPAVSSEDDTTAETVMKVSTPTSIRSILGGEGGLLSTFEGDLEFDGLTVKYYCKDNPRGKETGFEVRYGNNMTKMEHKREQQTDFTAIYPYHARKSTDSTSEENSTYRPVYIAKGTTAAHKFTRNWLTFEDGGSAFNPEKELVSASSPISSAIQVKTPGEYKDKLYIYISEKLLNTSGSVSNGTIGKIIDTVKNIVRVFNFIPVDWNVETYIPNNYYYTTETITEEHPIETCKFLLDSSAERVEGRVYYNAVLKGTTDILAGHYYPVPKYGYLSRLNEDVSPATAGIEIDDDENNKETWLSYEPGGDPISWNTTNVYMRVIPLQIQNGNAAGKMVIYNPVNKKYKELKSGIEKTYSTSETTSVEKVDLFTLKLYNDIQMDSDKLKNGNLYFYSAPSYEVTTVTSETYKPNEYYYISSTTYVIAKVTASTFKAGVYYKLNTDTKQYELVNTFDGTVLYYKKDIMAIDSSDSYTEGRTYYKQNNVYIPVFKSLDPSGFTYEANKYYYIDNDTIYEEDEHFTLDTNETPTEGRTYYELLVCKEIEEPVHENNFATLVTNKGYELSTVGTPRFELVTYTTYQSDKKYYVCNMTDSEPPVKSSDQYIDTVSYFRICPTAPIIYLDSESRTKRDDSKVLSVDLSSNIEGDPTADALLEAAFKYIEENQKTGEFNKVDDSLETSFVRLSDTLGYEHLFDLEKIQNGDIIKVINVFTGLETKLKVTSIEFDPISETYSDIELGSKPEDISDTVLTSGADISSLKNDEGYVDRAEVRKIVADEIDAKNLTVSGLIKAAQAQIEEMVVSTLNVTDLDASRIVAGSIGATNVSIKSKIEIEGYTFIDTIVDYESYNAYRNEHSSTTLYYKASEYSSDYIEDDGLYVYDRAYYYKEGTVFSVDNAGKLTANSVDVAGKITATSGRIADCDIVVEGGVTKLKVPAANITNLTTSVIDSVTGLDINIFANNGLYATNTDLTDVSDRVTTAEGELDSLDGVRAYSGLTGVTFSSSGFRVKKGNNDVFYLDASGNLSLSGTVNATGGTIGGVTIDNNSMYVRVNNDTVFYLDSTGSLTIKGTINATAGNIGGIAFTNNNISIPTSKIDNFTTSVINAVNDDGIRINISKLNNDAGFMSSVSWSDVDDRPTNVSDFNNDSNYATETYADDAASDIKDWYTTNYLDSNKQIKGATINAKGISVTNTSSETVFSIDANGNVYIKGEISASSGKIGGFTITDESLNKLHQNQSEHYHFQLSFNIHTGLEYLYGDGLSVSNDDTVCYINPAVVNPQMVYVDHKLLSRKNNAVYGTTPILSLSLPVDGSGPRNHPRYTYISGASNGYSNDILFLFSITNQFIGGGNDLSIIFQSSEYDIVNMMVNESSYLSSGGSSTINLHSQWSNGTGSGYTQAWVTNNNSNDIYINVLFVLKKRTNEPKPIT